MVGTHVFHSADPITNQMEKYLRISLMATKFEKTRPLLELHLLIDLEGPLHGTLSYTGN